MFWSVIWELSKLLIAQVAKEGYVDCDAIFCVRTELRSVAVRYEIFSAYYAEYI